jgi:hypothetical protein
MMKSRTKFALVLLALALGTCTAAEALAFGGIITKSPEIDPNLAVSAVALLGGTLAVLRLRRKK